MDAVIQPGPVIKNMTSNESAPTSTPSSLTLEYLPAELHLMILRNLDISSLRALIQASPVSHRVYLMEREELYTKVRLTSVSFYRYS